MDRRAEAHLGSSTVRRGVRIEAARSLQLHQVRGVLFAGVRCVDGARIMSKQTNSLLVLTLAVMVLAGCEAAKSSSPTSPSVAGPIAGVNITAPAPVTPGAGTTIPAKEQPITLTIQNSSTNGQRPITYSFEVAVDGEFANKVVTRDGVEPGGDGKTAFRLPDALVADRTYYWRAKALDGANQSSYSETLSFAVVILAEIQAPLLLFPINGATASSLTPEFGVANAARTGPAGAIAYMFEISENESFTAMAEIVSVAEKASVTKFTLGKPLKSNTRHYWRVRAYDLNVTSPWSLTQSFVTPKGVAAPPPPGPPSTGWPKNGQEVVAYATKQYPDRLVAGVSLSQRQANMAFLRDRMIEAGICGGMELAWNMKRGGPDKSIDYLAYRKNGTWIGVDIGAAYDDTSIPLRLQWGEGDSYLVFPATYSPAPSCK
jgi:hypothetical protein